MKTHKLNIITELAIERALQLVQFSNFVITRQVGDIKEADLPVEEIEDSLGGYTIPAIIVPVIVRYSDIDVFNLDISDNIPEVEGEMIMTDRSKPYVKFDAFELGAMRKIYDTNAK